MEKFTCTDALRKNFQEKNHFTSVKAIRVRKKKKKDKKNYFLPSSSTSSHSLCFLLSNSKKDPRSFHSDCIISTFSLSCYWISFYASHTSKLSFFFFFSSFLRDLFQRGAQNPQYEPWIRGTILFSVKRFLLQDITRKHSFFTENEENVKERKEVETSLKRFSSQAL